MLLTARIVLAALLVLPLAACGGKFEASESPGGDGGISDTGTGGGGADAGTGGSDAALCAEDQCGPRPRSPSQLCSDGSIGGFTGRCIDLGAGKCGWEFRDCPAEQACLRAADCGTDRYCVQAVGACGAYGKCAARPMGCDLLYAPVCGCDGKTYGNACAASQSGASVAYQGECKPSTAYCDASVMCPSGQFCKYPDGFCGSGSSPSPGPSPEPPGGTCTGVPMGCPDVWSPVCGCDNKTYGNACEASSSRMNVLHTGTCEGPPPPVKTCGGLAEATCAPNEWCDYPDGSYCGGDDSMGYCTPRPTTCSKELDPVCGCNGKTYSNACEAQKVGVDAAKKGPC